MLRLSVIFPILASLATAQEKITFDEHVLPLFQQACLNCHNPDKTKGGLDLSSFAATMKGSSSGKIVEPGDSGSTLISVVKQSTEPKMPPEGDPLSKQQIEILKRWIEGGLLENPSSTARKAPPPKFHATLRTDPAARPGGPPPMPEHLLLEPPVVTTRPSAVRALATSPWAPLLAVTSQRQILLHHSETLELIGILPFPEGDPVSLAFTPDGRHLIVGGGIPGKSGITVTFDITCGSRLLRAATEFDSILAADLRPGFDIIVTGGPSRLLKLWNTESSALLHSVKKHTDWITALDISPDGVLLASGDRNGGVWVWECATASEFHTLRAHQAAITATVFRADSNILATASEDGTLRFWEMNGGSEIKKIDAHPGGVTAFSFARDGSSLSVGRDLKAKLWKPDFNLARELSAKLPALPTAAALDADGKRAFLGDSRGTITALDTTDGKPLGEFQNNPPTIAARLTAITSLIQASKQPDPALEKSKKHWTAAAINTRLISTRAIAESSAIATEDAQLAFTGSASKIAAQAEILNRKRHQRHLLAMAAGRGNPSPETSAEISATLAAIDIVIARELETFHQFETEFVHIARNIDPSAILAHSKKQETKALEKSYHLSHE